MTSNCMGQLFYYVYGIFMKRMSGKKAESLEKHYGIHPA